MLWDLIRDWFVQYIWGGVTSTGASYGGLIGDFVNEDLSSNDILFSNTLWIKISNVLGSGDNADYTQGLYLSLGDWLSTTSTIVVMFLICVFLYMILRYAFRLTAGLMAMR